MSEFTNSKEDVIKYTKWNSAISLTGYDEKLKEHKTNLKYAALALIYGKAKLSNLNAKDEHSIRQIILTHVNETIMLTARNFPWMVNNPNCIIYSNVFFFKYYAIEREGLIRLTNEIIHAYNKR